MKMATVISGLLAMLLAASVAGAQIHYDYMLNGSGSLLLDDPTYSGTFLYGMQGTWSISIDDTGWPGQNDVAPTRFEHIWDTFFAPNYDATPGARAWYGYFDGLTLASTPQFVFDTMVPGGILAGDITIVIMVRDSDNDGVLDDAEKYAAQQYVATLSVNPSLATGAFVDLCGDGALSSGAFNFVDPPDVDTAQFPGIVDLDDCPPQPVEPVTWSTVKALYR
jgi:hypothetical protein